MNTENLKMVENEGMVAIYCDDLSLDISGFDSKGRVLIVVYEKPYTYVDARNVTAKGLLVARRNDGGVLVLESLGLTGGTEINWFNSAEKLLNKPVLQ